MTKTKTKNSRIVIVDSLMITPVGVNSQQTSSSVQAGIARFSELFWKNKSYEPIVMASISDDCLPEPLALSEWKLNFLEHRLACIFAAALLQFDKVYEKNIPLILGLPGNDEHKNFSRESLLEIFLELGKGRFSHEQSRVIEEGRASGLLAIDFGCRLLDGKAEVILAGGIDSFKDLNALGYLDAKNRLKTERNLDGLIPGEGAGFLLITTEDIARDKKWDILGEISATSTGFENGHLHSREPYKGDGLAGVVENIFTQEARAEQVGVVYSSMNGENYWSKEWGVTYLRNNRRFREDLALEHPSDCYGDLGSAAGPVMVGLAQDAIRTGSRNGPALVYSSSDAGPRAAVIVA